MVAAFTARRALKVGVPVVALYLGGREYLKWEERAHQDRLLAERAADLIEKEKMIALKYTDFMNIPRYKIWFRMSVLVLWFSPLIVTYPLTLVSRKFRRVWFKLLRATIQRSGPAFIKWGQWLTTRRELIPEDVREIMSGLFNHVSPHGMDHTRAVFQKDFGKTIEEVFAEFDPVPVGSGSIAQVHRAVLKDGRKVAVKVCHPKVRENIAVDFRCFLETAILIEKIIPKLEWLDVVGSCRQFITHLALQVDLTVEASNIRQFHAHFKPAEQSRMNFHFPTVVDEYVSNNVLVESWAEGAPLWPHLKPNMPYSERLCELGLEGWLKMILRDNFLHSDLHPGNILIDFQGMNPEECANPKITLVDCGLVLHFSNEQRRVLLDFIRGLAMKDPRVVADAVLRFSPTQPAVDREKFMDDMVNIFGNKYKTQRTHYAGKVTEVLSDLMRLVREHKVRIAPEYSNLLFSTMIQEAFINTLDPDFDVISRAKPHIFKVCSECVYCFSVCVRDGRNGAKTDCRIHNRMRPRDCTDGCRKYRGGSAARRNSFEMWCEREDEQWIFLLITYNVDSGKSRYSARTDFFFESIKHTEDAYIREIADCLSNIPNVSSNFFSCAVIVAGSFSAAALRNDSRVWS